MTIGSVHLKTNSQRRKSTLALPNLWCQLSEDQEFQKFVATLFWQVLIRHNQLVTMDPAVQPTVEELEAAKTCVILLTLPFFFVFLAYLEWKLLSIYYSSGHPWARIYREFPCHRKKFQSKKSTSNGEAAATEQTEAKI